MFYLNYTENIQTTWELDKQPYGAEDTAMGTQFIQEDGPGVAEIFSGDHIPLRKIIHLSLSI